MCSLHSCTINATLDSTYTPNPNQADNTRHNQAYATFDYAYAALDPSNHL